MKKYIKKISKFKYNKVSVLIILVFVPQPPILEMCLRSSSVVVSSKGKNTGKTKIKQNHTKQTNKNTPQSIPNSNAIQFQ
jgi:hypothetical protein